MTQSRSNEISLGRQGAGGRTHLMSPVMAAAAALVGKLADVRDLASEPVAPAKESQPVTWVPETDLDSDEDIERLLDLPEDIPSGSATESAAASGGQTPFTKVKGIAAPMNRSNVDTDAIIPKQFLKTIKRTGLGSALFYALRYNEDGKENPDFILNQEPYRQSKILVVTGPNFGCGSSREHAPWSIKDFGITCMIAPSYGEIFFTNAVLNGLLPLTIADSDTLAAIAAEAGAGREIEVDLVNQRVNDASGAKLASFEIEPFRKHCLVEGLDEISLTLQAVDKIKKFEQQRTIDTPWLDGTGYMRRDQQNDEPTKIEAAPVPATNRGAELKEPLDW